MEKVAYELNHKLRIGDGHEMSPGRKGISKTGKGRRNSTEVRK